MKRTIYSCDMCGHATPKERLYVVETTSLVDPDAGFKVHLCDTCHLALMERIASASDRRIY